MFAVWPWHLRSTSRNCQEGKARERRFAKDKRLRRLPKMPWISTAVGGCGPRRRGVASLLTGGVRLVHTRTFPAVVN
jgi:hypothetical protein